MHCLEQIDRANNRAFARAILAARDHGPVVVVHEGLHIGRFQPCATLAAAERVKAEIEAKREPGVRVEVLPALTAAERAVFAGRDQSEDYAERGVVVFTQAHAGAPLVRSVLAA